MYWTWEAMSGYIPSGFSMSASESNTCREVLTSWQVNSIVSPRTKMPYMTRTFTSAVLPFCLGTESPHVEHTHV